MEEDVGGHETKVALWKGHLVTAASIADVIILGCKSEDLDEMLSSESLVEQFHGKLVISLMAGLSPARLVSIFSELRKDGDYHVVQAIPSIGARMGESITLITGSGRLNGEHSKQLTCIFESIGAVKHVPQSMMDDVVAIGAVTHALTILAVDAITDAGVAKGLPRSTVASLVAQNLRSASGLLDSGMSPESLKAAMSTPSGITLNSMLQLESGGTRSAVQDAASFAVDYARQMSTKD